ncbi:MAG: hypothetical protein D6785_02195, partial [Planctomycetota bacterium]
CRPFDAHRQGMSLGEGAGFVVLEPLKKAKERDANIYGLVIGKGASCDGYHMSGPHPEGEGIRRAMEIALKEGNLPPEKIDYINAHGTGTLDNDYIEAKIFQEIFGTHLPSFSSTKGFTGHCLGATGAMELIITLWAMEEGRIPPNLGFSNLDKKIGVAPEIEALSKPIYSALNPSIGFGGNNCVLLIQKNKDKIEKGFPHTSISSLTKLAIWGAGACFPEEKPAPLSIPFEVNLPPFFVYQLSRPLSRGDYPSLKWRKWSNTQRMAMIAAKEVMESLRPFWQKIPPQERAVFAGTGLGETGHSGEFLKKIFESQEKEPSPNKFVNSVHNSIAAALAIEWGFKGENHTFSHDYLSFELALWGAWQCLNNKSAKMAFLSAVDEANPYSLLFGYPWDMWKKEKVKLTPCQYNGEKEDGLIRNDFKGTVLGEGASFFILGPYNSNPEIKPLAFIQDLDIHFFPCYSSLEEGIEKEALYLEKKIKTLNLESYENLLFLLGANGDPALD